MIYCLYGLDSLRKKEKLNFLLNNLSQKNNTLEKLNINLEEESYKNVIEFAGQQSIFGGNKVIVVENALLKEKEWIDFLKRKVSNKDSFIFLLDEKNWEESFDFLKKKPVEFFNLNELEGQELEKFIFEEALKNNLKLSKKAVENLKAYALSLKSNRSWMLSKEIEKAAFLGKNYLDWEDFEKISYFPQIDEVWKLTKKIIQSRTIYESLPVLEKLFLSGTDPAYIFNSLAFNAYSNDDVSLLSELDVSMKSGKLEFAEALLFFSLRGV